MSNLENFDRDGDFSSVKDNCVLNPDVSTIYSVLADPAAMKRINWALNNQDLPASDMATIRRMGITYIMREHGASQSNAAVAMTYCEEILLQTAEISQMQASSPSKKAAIDKVAKFICVDSIMLPREGRSVKQMRQGPYAN